MLKTYLLILFAALTYVGAHAQATLQFSQAKLVTSSEQVPSGKVWKVTNVLSTTRLTSAEAAANNSSATQSTQQVITVNGNSIYMASSDTKALGFSHYDYVASSSSASALSLISGPIWLPAGTTLAAGSGVYAVSVLEFTEVP